MKNWLSILKRTLGIYLTLQNEDIGMNRKKITKLLMALWSSTLESEERSVEGVAGLDKSARSSTMFFTKRFGSVCRTFISLLLAFILLCSFWPFSRKSNTTRLRINTLETTNGGTPFYLFVKEVEKGEFLKHEYQHIVHEAFPFTDTGPDIHPYIIFPG